MTAENAANLESAVTATLPRDRRPTEDEVRERAEAMRAVFSVTNEEFDHLLRILHARLAIDMDLGTSLVAVDHAPWLAGRKAGITPFYWERYRKFLLREGRPPLVVTALDAVTDEILDLTGDPARPGMWGRRGLVIGDVQSGKTGSYTALICKAADAGYGLAILLTGSLENLRRQTQERLDEGFVGFDSAERLKAQVSTSRSIGVGLIDQTRAATVFTSRSRDFNKALVNQLNLRLASQRDPVLMVVKKNRRVLENLDGWLRAYNAGSDTRIDAPLLLIDDEADAGSINTAAEDDSPTKVNEAIRKLLTLFHRSAYVGFTATPFANVFVDPDSTQEGMLGDDLFPRDFIYTLEAPSNYFGPEKVFAGDAGPIRTIDDAEPYFPSGHKSDFQVNSLPASLYDAIRSYLVVTTLRDMRGQQPPHRSMLVNVSSMTRVQNQVVVLIDDFVRDVQRDIRNYAALDESEALLRPSIAALQRTWLEGFDDGSASWLDVQHSLHDSVQPVVVRAVNQTTGAASLDYRDQGDHGLRVIAVGGNSLSRGLTLEGLTTSYFYRNSQAYDTLMQMGRWFGYRDGYDDLCRVWMTEETQGNYAYVARAADELRSELKRMKRLGLTPREFGLKVRSHPDTLLVTARNKMRRANDLVWEVSLDGKLLETSRLRSTMPSIRANNETVAKWIAEVARDLGEAQPSMGAKVWTMVDKGRVADLLYDFQTHPLNYDFQADQLAEYLRSTNEEALQFWDVSVPSGSAEEITIGEMKVLPRTRSVVPKAETSSLLVSGSSARVGSPGDERIGLSPDEITAADAGFEGRTTPGDRYRDKRTRPLLMVNVIKPVVRRLGGDRKDVDPLLPEGTPLIALGISFPHFDDSQVKARAVYKVNQVLWRSLFEQEAGDELEADDEPD